MVTDRLGKYRDAGVTTLKLGLDSAGPLGPARYELLEQIVDITRGLLMKLYMVPLAPNPTKVMLYIAEREELGVQMSIEQIIVNTVKGRHKEPAHWHATRSAPCPRLNWTTAPIWWSPWP